MNEEKWMPKDGEVYYVPDIHTSSWYALVNYKNDNMDKKWFARGLVYRTKEEAITRAKEMCGIYVIDGIEYKRGEMVEVKDNECEAWSKRMFYEKTPLGILCVHNGDEENYKNNKNFYTLAWEHIRKIQQSAPKRVTKEQLWEVGRKEFGDNFEVVE